MRFHVLVTPRFPIPPGQLGELASRSSGWYDHYRDSIEALGVFPGGGAFAVINVDDEPTLHRMTLEMPFSRFAEAHVQPFVDAQQGWEQLGQVAERAAVAVHA